MAGWSISCRILASGDKMSEVVLDFIFQYHFLQGGIDGIAGSVSILSRERCTVLHSEL